MEPWMQIAIGIIAVVVLSLVVATIAHKHGYKLGRKSVRIILDEVVRKCLFRMQQKTLYAGTYKVTGAFKYFATMPEVFCLVLEIGPERYMCDFWHQDRRVAEEIHKRLSQNQPLSVRWDAERQKLSIATP